MQSQHQKVIAQKSYANASLQVLEYERLLGSGTSSAANLYYMEKIGMRLRTVRVQLEHAKLVAEPGALQYMRGQIELKTASGGGVAGFLQRAVTAVATGETISKSEFIGTGEIVLEPSFEHYLLLDLNGELVTDRGAFLAGVGDLKFSAKRPDSIAAGALAGEGFFQTQISGQGVVVLQSPVPEAELVKIELQKDRLMVDGNFALARTGALNMSIQKSTKALLGNLKGGEGLVTVFEGTGTVWLAPTQHIYGYTK
jgi:uncharacterized protein (AIM24 family)